MSPTRQTPRPTSRLRRIRGLLACFGALALVALPLACASESTDPSANSSTAFEAPHGCGDTRASECEQNEICKLAVGACHKAGARGVCMARPEMCPMILAPVCGCDDQTYNNACEALRAAVNVAYEGPCGPFLCGGPSGIQCAPTQYCAAADCDAIGFCVDRPESCDTRLGTPVCGCDRKTYESACAAHAAGVTVFVRNACPVVPWVPSAAAELKPPHSIR